MPGRFYTGEKSTNGSRIILAGNKANYMNNGMIMVDVVRGNKRVYFVGKISRNDEMILTMELNPLVLSSYFWRAVCIEINN